MNIFKALSQGNGRISETNLTSFLSYLLNNNREIGNSFFLLFIESIRNIINNNITIVPLNGTSFREKLLDYENNFTHLATPEFPVQNRDEKQIIDIYLKITNREENDVVYFLIENKIKVGARNETQCSNQYELFKSSEEYQQNIPIYNILLTIDSDSFASMYEESKRCNPNSLWIKWTSRNIQSTSIETIFKELLSLETKSDIPPVDFSSLFIIKSFVDYISTEFSFRARRSNYSIAGFEVSDSVEVILDEKSYLLKRYENKMIRLFDSEENLMDIDIKPVLRKINDIYQLNVILFGNNGRLKNTQVLGRDIIKSLKARSA